MIKTLPNPRHRPFEQNLFLFQKTECGKTTKETFFLHWIERLDLEQKRLESEMGNELLGMGEGGGRKESSRSWMWGNCCNFAFCPSIPSLKAGVTNCPYFRRGEEDRRAYQFPERSAKEKRFFFIGTSTQTLGNSVRGFLKSWEGKGV